MGRPAPRGAAWLLPVAVYCAAALVYTWPLAIQFSTHLAALHGPGDPYLYVWILGWNLETISADPAALVNGRIFDANIYHPARQTLAYSDHMLPQSVLLWPLYAVTRDPVLCYNALFLGSLAASGLAMHLLARRLSADEVAAYGAGIAWAFWPFHFSHLAHLQLQGLYVLPIAFLFLHRLLTGGTRRDALLLGLAAGVQTLVSTYYGVIGAVGLAAATLSTAPFHVTRTVETGRGVQAGRLIRHVILAAVVGAAIVVPAALPYWQVQQREGFGRNLDEASRHAARLSSYLAVPPTNALYGATRLLPVGAEEQALFPGALLVVLAACGLVAAARSGPRRPAAAACAVAAAGLVLSLGPEGVRSIYAALHRWVFGFHAIRAPARFSVLVTLGLAVLAALGLADLRRRADGKGMPSWLPTALVVLMAVEYVNVGLAYAPAPALHTAAGAWLRDEPGPGAVLYLPLELDAPSTTFMVQSLEHRRPIVNGASGHRPGFFTSVVDTMATFPDPEALWMLRELDVRFVVAPGAIRGADDVLVARALLPETGLDRMESHIYEVRWTAEAEARFEEAAVRSPPEPGTPPFQIGESAEYDVRWLGGGASLSAGTIRIRVDAPPADGSARYQFEASAETADWVARFFEARDRFTTTADERLRPILHERAIREGRRRLDRLARFDHDRRTVSVYESAGVADGISHRIAPGTRDAVTAFFYLRSLDLTSADDLELPINEVGRNQTLVVKGATRDTIVYGGKPAAALRLEPQIVQRVARRAPVQIVVWLSDDERRVPLQFDVSGAFGTVRAVLRSYQRTRQQPQAPR